jgi:long-chain acyl-CoA synthetase
MMGGVYCKVSDYSKNLVSLLVNHASTQPNAIALRHKKIGLWQTWTWEKLLALSERYTSALQEYSFQKEHSLVIICSPNVDVIAISLAVQALGGRVQLIDQSDDTLQTDEILEHLSNLKPDYLLIEQLEQLVSLDALNYHPTYIFYIEQNHLHHFDHEYVIRNCTKGNTKSSFAK